MKGRSRRLRPVYSGMKFFKETCPGQKIVMPGGGNNLRIKLAANLEDITNTAAYNAVGTRTALKTIFGRYCITGVKFTFIPYYTQSIAGAGQVANRVVYAINRDPTDVAQSEDDIVRQDDAKFTNTTRKFSIYVKHPKPVLYSTAGISNVSPNQAPEPAGGAAPNSNQVAVTLGANKWTWLPTRYLVDPEAGTKQNPDHVGADVHITNQNPGIAEEYPIYTMFKTIYFAFKEQD